MTDKPQCKETVFGDWGPHQCSRKSVRGDYCVQHSPEAVKERKDKADKKYKKDMERPHAHFRRIEELEAAEAKLKAVEGVLETESFTAEYYMEQETVVLVSDIRCALKEQDND